MRHFSYTVCEDIYHPEDGYLTGYENVEYTFAITDAEALEIESLTAEALYEHMRQGIGSMAALGESKFLPCYEIGGFRLSCQINYQLWSLRDDRGIACNAPEMYAPMTEEEFNTVLPHECKRIDFAASYNGRRIYEPGQESLMDIVEFLQEGLK